MGKKAEEARYALEGEKNLLQTMIDCAKNSPLAYLDRNFNFVRVNEAYARTCGYTPDEMMGKNHFALYPNKAREVIFAQVRDSGIAAEFKDHSFVFPDQPERGVTFWDWTLVPVKDSSGEVEGLVFSLFETTERKTAEEALRQAAERYQLALNAAELGTWEYRFSTAELIWDERCCRLFGLESGDRIGFERTISVIHPEDRPGIINAYVDAIAGRREGAFNQEFRVVWPDGSTHWIASNGRIYYEGDRPARIIGVDVEITERKKMEEDLLRSRDELEARVQERTAELERKNQELQEFAFIASHDLSEPLRKIQNFGSLLETKEADRLTDAGKSYVLRMTEAANRMQQLLDALLRYSRVQTDVQEFSAANLDDVLRDVLSDLEVGIKNTGAHVNIARLPVVRGNPYQLRQLFENLVANAIKYCRKGEEPVIGVHGEEKDGKCTVFVEDNGVGFDEKYLDKIFQPFQRLHGRSEYPGMGMGLAICKKIVERHEGTITAKATPGRGAVFIVTLPAYESAEPKP